MTGVDSADAATRKSEGRFETDYTKYLTADALKGARIGVARDFVGHDPDVDWVFEAALESMRRAGATVVDVRYPNWLLTAKDEFYNAIRRPEFTVQVGQYLSTLGPKYPEDAGADDRTRERSSRPRAAMAPARIRAAGRCSSAKSRAERRTIIDTRRSATTVCRSIRAAVEGILTSQKLDAIVYPTASRRPALIAERRRRRRRPTRFSAPWGLARPISRI